MNMRILFFIICIVYILFIWYFLFMFFFFCFFFFFQAEDGIRYAQESRGLGDVYKRQILARAIFSCVGVGDGGDDEDLVQLWPRASITCLVRYYTSDQARRTDTVPMTSTCSNTYGEGLFNEFAKSKSWKRCESHDNNNDGGGSGVVCRLSLIHI
eukprot:TRINITY_DN18232_c0_g1_i1.p1 TRINITY_DN18232_c0_g1~~TRINITY_DN18232_c0_g1_i1.p1  ORF type:complete len:155 (-),score=27.02 TRINITY_DN18232_c0_g1_i1:194-658(-)